MIDIQFIRENPDKVKEFSAQKNITVDVDQLLELDQQRRTLQQQIDSLRQERNTISENLKGQKPPQEIINKGKQLKEALAKLEAELESLNEKYLNLLKQIPNAPWEDVPVGKSEVDNVVTKEWGEKPKFDFEAQNHWQIGEKRGWIDKERAAKVAGSRFVYLKGDLVLLEFALWQFAFSKLTDPAVLQEIIQNNDLKVTNKPFIPVLPPAVARTEVYEATARLNKEEQTYKLKDEDLWLNASAEHTLAPMYINEILKEADLPIRYLGYTTAFRREAGTYGKDLEGIIRLHQFNKLEIESFSTATDSLQEHLFLIAIQEYLMQQLQLPYRILQKCTADIGGPNARGVDIEAWLPGQGKYLETHTADYMTDYQSRRLQTRVRRSNDEIELVHTNDATVFSERPLIAIIENYQEADGRVKVPEVLQSYIGGEYL